MRTSPLVVCAVLLAGCPSNNEAPAAATGDTKCPSDAPVQCKVLEDKLDNNAIEYHVLVADTARHDDVEALLKYLYRYLWTRHDEPSSGGAYVYTSEAAYKTPPR